MKNIKNDENESRSEILEQFKDKLNGAPVVALAMGLPRNDNAGVISRHKYKANKIYNWFEQSEKFKGKKIYGIMRRAYYGS